MRISKMLLMSALAVLIVGGVWAVLAPHEVRAEVELYKSPTCGCCRSYIPHLESGGFDVDARDVGDLDGFKDRHNIPSSLRSCHTGMIEGYIVEGHVPIEAIERLLAERPAIDGIALPDMPSGTPGMPGPKREEWVIYAINDGEVEEYMRI